jgi:hypothetical protein
MQETSTTLWLYLRSASPVYTCTLPSLDTRLAQVLEDVRKIRHGNHVFVHLRSQYEWERAMACLGVTQPAAPLAPSSAA